jgi:predicted aconitase with swiveling domain
MTAKPNARTRVIEGRSIVRGKASGPALVSQAPISFLGDLEITTGRIVGKVPGVEGRNLKGTVLVLPDSMGSAGAWRFLYQLFAHGNHPVAIVSQIMPDPSLIQGAILANIPIVCEASEDVVQAIKDGEHVEVDTEGPRAVIRVTGPV